MSELDDLIKTYRQIGYESAEMAAEMLAKGGYDHAVLGCIASMATMHLTLALDARLFGDPPEPRED